MSIQQAFDSLTQSLGEDFLFKDDPKGFAKAVMSVRPKKQDFATYILQLHEDACYFCFEVTYDSINRRNRLGDYRILSEDLKVLNTDDDLREHHYPVHSAIHNFLSDVFCEDVYTEDEFDGEPFYFNLHTFHYDDIEEEDE